jgi:hypothetical protein
MNSLGSLFDRVNVTLAGQSIIGNSPAYVLGCDANMDGQLVAVNGFSANKLVTGFVTGNKQIDVSIELALVSSEAPPRLDQLDYDNSNIQIALTAATGNYLTTDNEDVYNGGWMLIFIGTAWGSMGWSFPGSGQNAKMPAHFKAINAYLWTPPTT